MIVIVTQERWFDLRDEQLEVVLVAVSSRAICAGIIGPEVDVRWVDGILLAQMFYYFRQPRKLIQGRFIHNKITGKGWMFGIFSYDGIEPLGGARNAGD